MVPVLFIPMLITPNGITGIYILLILLTPYQSLVPRFSSGNPMNSLGISEETKLMDANGEEIAIADFPFLENAYLFIRIVIFILCLLWQGGGILYNVRYERPEILCIL